MPKHNDYNDYIDECSDWDGRSDISRLNALIQVQIETIAALETLSSQIETLTTAIAKIEKGD